MNRAGKQTLKSFTSVLCAALLLSTSVFMRAHAMGTEDLAQQQVAGDVGSHDIAGAAALAGAGGGGHHDRHDEPRPPSTRPYLVPGFIACNIFLFLTSLGLTGGWIGEHFTHDQCPNGTELN